MTKRGSGEYVDQKAATLVTVATYNEIENLPRLVKEIFAYAPQVDILVIDDNSPDGTGRWCDENAETYPRLHCLHREERQGLGAATFAAMRYAVEHDYAHMLNMDADFSHHPRFLPDFLRIAAEQAPVVDVVIGSRYVPGGGVEGWPLRRRLMSRAINFYARLLLGLKVRDCSGSFRCYRIEMLKKIDLNGMRSQGYSYLEEILWRLQTQGAVFRETPIVFREREQGHSKINLKEALTAVWIIFLLGLRRCLPLE